MRRISDAQFPQFATVHGVPEPSALLLVLTGFGMVGCMLRRCADAAPPMEAGISLVFIRRSNESANKMVLSKPALLVHS